MTSLNNEVDVVSTLSSGIRVSETLEVFNLFPIPVGSFRLKRKLTKSEFKFIESLDKTSNVGNHSTKYTYILNDKRLKKLKEFFSVCVNEYASRIMSMSSGTDLYITQSWANFTKTGEYHHKHEHPNSIVSGVFYVKTDAEADKIYFERNEYKQIKPEVSEFNVYNSDSWWYQVQEGQLVLFPSSLSHRVETIEKEGHERISLSFNTFPKGNLGIRDNLTECILEETIHNVK